MSKSDQEGRTGAVRAGIESDRQYGAVAPPLYLTSNYTFREMGQPRAYDYSRTGNPTRDLLGDAIAEQEGGAGGVITASGMAAATLVCQLLKPGDILIAPHDCYGGTYRLFNALAERGQFQVRFVNQSDPQALAGALSERPRLVWVESPSNPLLRIVDLRALSRLCRLHGALMAVDNTFLSPALQKPISLGADIVVHSTTKYLNGHSDVVGGAVVSADATLHEELAWWANCLGITGAPFDSFLTLRGLRTLHARIRLHEENAGALVSLLSDHPAVSKVHYPGLASHPGHEIAASQQRGFGGMISFELHGSQQQAGVFLNALKLFSLAESLGGVESLVAHPATMSHAAMGPEGRKLAGITDNLIRLSVGIENVEDLLADLKAGLDKILGAQRTTASAEAL
jgi:cystathionine gamma-synthase